MTLDETLRLYEAELAAGLERSGRPEHPALRGLSVDPSARLKESPSGDPVTAEERTMMGRVTYHVAEGLYAGLTPLGMLCLTHALLQFLTIEPGTVEDVWGEAESVSPEAREELGRAGWHLERAWDMLGWPTGEVSSGGSDQES